MLQHSGVKTTRDRREGFQVSLTTKLIKQLSLTDRQTSVSSEDDHDDFEKWGYFGILPVRMTMCDAVEYNTMTTYV